MPNLNDANSSFWNAPLSSLLSSLESESDRGLSGSEAERRLERFGPNVVSGAKGSSALIEFLSHFQNPLVILLIAASGISALTGDRISFIMIVIMVLMSVTLDFVQEHRAGKAADRLAARVAVRASTWRDGVKREVPMARLVPGDVVELSAGDLVPADGRLLHSLDLFINQAVLTGESFPVEKRAEDLHPPADTLADASNAVFLGSSIVSGSARMIVCRTGRTTAIGEIAHALVSRPPSTAFERGTYRFGLLIMRLTILLVLFVLLVNAVLHRPLLESFLFAIALAVGLTPELLPMVVSVTLSRGAIRMAKRRVIVKKLSAIHDLGSMDVFCTDKTGTLTEARIRLEKHLNPQGEENERVLELAYLNSFHESGLKSPLDDAILRHSDLDVSSWSKIDEVPFDFERRRVSVLLETAGQRQLIVKGAPEDILRLSTEFERPDGSLAPLTCESEASIKHVFDELSRQGFRVLGIAWRAVPPEHSHAVVTDETELVFAGFAAFLDPPKPSASAALAALERDGVSIKIVTGDNELVTQHVCQSVGLQVRGLLLGKEVQHLSDEALRVRVNRANLICRVTPSEKNRVILALKAGKRVVGYLGDGINDAPSIQAADVGISVDSAVDVAKQAADMILLEQDLNVLHEGIREGRRTYSNVLKYIMMGTSSNFGNMLSMAMATLFLPFLPMLPLQILLNNLLYDLSEVAIPLDNVDEEQLAKPRVWDMSFIRSFMLTTGPISSIFDFLTFFLMLKVFHASETLFRTGWFVESLASQVLVIFVIRTRKNPLASRPNRWLAGTSILIMLIGVILPYVPLGRFFRFEPLPAPFLAALVVVLAVYLTGVEHVKRAFYRRRPD